jgi:hypothetical protein
MPAVDLVADAFAELPAPATRCSLGRILDAASPVARERLQAALAAEHVSNNWITTQLRAAKLSLAKDTVGQHRRGECRCTGEG